MQCPACEREVPLGESLCPACLSPVEAEAPAAPRIETPVSEPAVTEPASAPATRCPVHPDMPVAGTCARCGSFLCIRCTRDVLSTTAPLCPTCAARPTDGPAGLGGWLVVPAIIAVLQPVLGLLAGSYSLYLAASGQARNGAMVAGPLLAYGGFATMVAVQFFRRKSSAPALYIAMLVVNVGLALVLRLGALCPGVVAAVWTPYFLMSSRVKATFVR